MSLPKIALPEYIVQLHSIKDPVRFRPYTVKEEKIFLMAKESSNPEDIERAVRQVLKNCTFEKINIDALPSFDLEYLFLQTRAKSVNNVAELQYRCRKVVDGDRRCDTLVPVKIPLDDVHIVINPQHQNVITLDNKMVIELQYPSINTITPITSSIATSIEQPIAMLAGSIKQIVDATGVVYETKDYSAQEVIEFIESLSFAQLEQLQTFFATMPKLSYDTEFVCPKCQYRESLHFEGLTDFFG